MKLFRVLHRYGTMSITPRAPEPVKDPEPVPPPAEAYVWPENVPTEIAGQWWEYLMRQAWYVIGLKGPAAVKWTADRMVLWGQRYAYELSKEIFLRNVTWMFIYPAVLYFLYRWLNPAVTYLWEDDGPWCDYIGLYENRFWYMDWVGRGKDGQFYYYNCGEAKGQIMQQNRMIGTWLGIMDDFQFGTTWKEYKIFSGSHYVFSWRQATADFIGLMINKGCGFYQLKEPHVDYYLAGGPYPWFKPGGTWCVGSGFAKWPS